MCNRPCLLLASPLAGAGQGREECLKECACPVLRVSERPSFLSLSLTACEHHLKMLIPPLLLLLLLQQWPLTNGAADPIYLVAVTSQTVSGTTETLCAQISAPTEALSLVVTLRCEDQSVTILKQSSITANFYKCVPFKVPQVMVESVATVNVAIQGNSTSLNKTSQILINPPQKLTFIQSDRPIYKPGQSVKFRIVSLDTKFLPYNQVFSTVELQDPSGNRIAQWLNQSTKIGILDLFHSISPEAAQGYYTITAWDEKNQQLSTSFEIKEYVLPKYEVNIDFPSLITTSDEEVLLKVCARYTYGKPVLGLLTAGVCAQSWYYYYDKISPENAGVCKKFSTMTGKDGCGSWLVNVTDFGLNFGGNFDVKSEVEETATGIIMSGSATAMFTTDYVTANFQDTADTYKPGMLFTGKIIVTNAKSTPMSDESVTLNAYYGDNSVSLNLTTDIDGTAQFTFDTTDWSELPVSLQADISSSRDPVNYWAFRYYPSNSLYLRPFYSKSKSFLSLKKASQMFSCNQNATVTASYIIQGTALRTGQKALEFFYLVLSRGSMVQNGRLPVTIKSGKAEIMGELTFSLKNTPALAPFAQVVVYTILPNGEAVADSMNFPIQECLPNKVSLRFSSPIALPGDKTSFNLSASPGSLCSVRAIDQSVLILRPEAELTAETVFGMLPVQILSGYPYNVEEFQSDPCARPIDNILPKFRPSRRKRSLRYRYFGNSNDVSSIFRGIGIKIATNAEVKAPIDCNNDMMFMEKTAVMFSGASENAVAPAVDLSPNKMNSPESVRTYFPETWIWDLVPVGKSGSVEVTKTVPDTITKWAAGAFCTSSVGFGIAPSTNLTAFQPFFLSLTLPYSIIRGETFTLKASVFNYLSECIMVNVTLAQSSQFTSKQCKGCTYVQCVCGQVNFTVRAEAVKTQQLCGKQAVTLPSNGRTDIVMQSILVNAEGTKQSITQNELLCLTDTVQETSNTLSLPKTFVKDSAKSFITVLGDLMGRALMNIGDLLAMPYGCGEQNMLLFAPNIYILQYLESSGQLTPQIKARAVNFLVNGYQQELTYKHLDGSYSAFGNSDPSGNTWLTAFVMKTFGGAKKYIFIDQSNIDQAKDWLAQQQETNGCFASVGKLFHNELKGGVSDEVTLSAYITAALLELGVSKSDPMVERSLGCLKEAAGTNTNTYVSALLSYTFTLAGDAEMRKSLLSSLDMLSKRKGAGRYWTLDANSQVMGSLEVEMSSYVLLALLSGPSLPGFGLNYSSSIVQWLSKQQNTFGGFSSTQDTVVALQALAKYSAATYNPAGTITVTVTSPAGKINQFTVNQSNRLLYQEKQLPENTGTYKLQAKGKGCVFVQFALNFNIPPPPDALAFSIKADTGVCDTTNNPAFSLTISVRYDGSREETNMVIVSAKLLSGFSADETSLQALKEDPEIKRLDQDEDRIYIYLDSLEKEVVKSISLTLVQDVVVQDLRPAVLTVYDYYKTSEVSMTEYRSPCA
ncbi:hypothetical protein DNTS_000609 [Danionella cerebrum]|uniref:Alpha-2-macroglobulin-like protein 1 n=1 Tax=Danionella cerebrum TaxID=2873325 RepID=A0A553R7V5_9TELE|nr:hypothetical protein DNTS_000609 [Danionella translucida]TRY98264.1 hypothetical protein DNTS_000609 [Danionella translucida]TRY98265.1 hypothetical protein DNTS_000609 [Danionella translucida]